MPSAPRPYILPCIELEWSIKSTLASSEHLQQTTICWTWQDHGTHELIVAVTVYTRPVQDQAKIPAWMGKRLMKSLLWLKSCWQLMAATRMETPFSLEVWSLRGHLCSSKLSCVHHLQAALRGLRGLFLFLFFLNKKEHMKLGGKLVRGQGGNRGGGMWVDSIKTYYWYVWNYQTVKRVLWPPSISATD